MYRTLLADLRSMNPRMKTIGLTATAYRTDSGMLHEGSDRLFTDIAYDIDVLRLIDSGYLCPVVPKRVDGTIKTDGVSVRGGDFVPGELEAAAMGFGMVAAAVGEILRYGADRKSWLVFASGIDHARAIAAMLAESVNAATIFGETPSNERAVKINALRSGSLRCIVNVGVLTTGFNAPGVDLIALLRPTKSPGLFVQQVGRGLRNAPGKNNCLILDFGENVTRHGPINMVRPKRKESNGAEAPPVKYCPECATIVFAALRTCPDCGYEWPEREVVHAMSAGTQELLQRETDSVWPVVDVAYKVHRKPGKPLSLCVTYLCTGRRFVDEWVCLEHTGFARQKAESWWLARAPAPVPATVNDAIRRQDEIRIPAGIKVVPDGGYHKIVGVYWPKENVGNVPF